MNDQVEEIYERMFAPNEIPQAVRELYQRVQFFVSKIDCPGMKMSQLALIAGIATANPAQAVAVKPHKDAVIDTAEADAEIPDPAPQSPAAGQTPPEEPIEPALDITGPGGPTGPMDAPAKRLKNPKTEVQLMRMTARELRVQARDFHGKRFRRDVPKPDIVKFILASRE